MSYHMMTAASRYTFSDKRGGCIRYAAFPSNHCGARTIDIWCPPDYERSLAQRYPVIYMHDGQNLFDPALAFIGVDWGVDESVVKVMSTGGCKGAIIVGIWNTPLRYREYMPEQPFVNGIEGETARRFVAEKGGEPISDGYLRLIVEELKPLVDRNFRTMPEQSSTFIMGSSMGGLISLYAIESYPQIFGGAACLSTHWPIGGELLVDAMGRSLPSPREHRLYFDFGTLTLDASYEPFQRRMDA
ncbi:MAG: alpha/beta hydrolase, partial [Nitrospirales bacterium]|nr:alpha/beta hydrolase [Nitrospirales bacterium]